MSKDYSHLTLCKESNLSFALLKEIMSVEEDLKIHSDKIQLYGAPFKDKDGKDLLVYNSDAIKKRRKDKERYTYFNAFNNKSHFDLIIDQLNKYNNEIDCIEIEKISELTGWFKVQLKSERNEVLKEMQVYDCEKYNEQTSIIRLLLSYYDVIVR